MFPPRQETAGEGKRLGSAVCGRDLTGGNNNRNGTNVSQNPAVQI